VYTDGHRLFKAPSDPSNGNFQPVTLPDLPNTPSNTAGRVASFAAADLGSVTRLFYGNYPSVNDVYTSQTCSQHNNDPSFCQHAYIWHSDSCGDNWSAPFAFGEPTYHAQEVHAINVDPANPWNIYATIDVENADTQLMGLWKSTDAGNNFTHVSTPTPGAVITPINFVFPRNSNKIFLETDGDPAENPPPNGGPSGTFRSRDSA